MKENKFFSDVNFLAMRWFYLDYRYLRKNQERALNSYGCAGYSRGFQYSGYGLFGVIFVHCL